MVQISYLKNRVLLKFETMTGFFFLPFWVWYMSQEFSAKKIEVWGENFGSASYFCVFQRYFRKIQKKIWHICSHFHQEGPINVIHLPDCYIFIVFWLNTHITYPQSHISIFWSYGHISYTTIWFQIWSIWVSVKKA